MNKWSGPLNLFLVVISVLYILFGYKTYRDIDELNQIQVVLHDVSSSDFKFSVYSELLRNGISHSEEYQMRWVEELEYYNASFDRLMTLIDDQENSFTFNSEIEELHGIWESTYTQISRAKDRMKHFVYLPRDKPLHSYLITDGNTIPRSERYALAQLNYELEAYDSFVKGVLTNRIEVTSGTITPYIIERKRHLRIQVLALIPVITGIILALALALIKLRKKERARTIQLKEMHKLEAVGRSAGQISHDFKNILSGIIGFSELGMTDNECPTEFKEYFRSIIEASERAVELSGSITRFSRDTNAGTAKIELKKILTEVNHIVKVILPSTITFTVVSPVKGAIIEGNSTQLYQLFMNLAINASHAIKGNGDIAISANKRGQVVRIDISDTGCGIPEKILENIFDLGFTTKKNNGSGFGLCIVKDIVESHRGTISVKSTVGKGTVFTIELPLCD